MFPDIPEKYNKLQLISDIDGGVIIGNDRGVQLWLKTIG
jgi:hypothetical protein